MTTLGIADFSGMMPLRDPVLLQDNYSQFSQNTWLYKGAMRGYRVSPHVYNLVRPLTSKQVYRIPLNSNLTDWANSLWLEFPDQYMKVIRGPVVGDQFDRYYFFPSSSFVNDPGWPDSFFAAPFYAPLANIIAGGPYYILGIPLPGNAPLVSAAPTDEVLTASADTPAGNSILHFASTDSLGTGMEILDLTATTLNLNTNAVTPAGDNVLDFAATTGVTVGMTVLDTTNTDTTTTATASTPAGGTVLSLTSTAGITVGMQVTDTTVTNFTIAANGFVTMNGTAVGMSSLTGITVGLTIADLTTPGAFAGGTTVTGINPGPSSITYSPKSPMGSSGTTDSIQFTNPNQIPAGTKVQWVSSTQVGLSNPTTGAGVLDGDTIQFTSGGAIPANTTVEWVTSTQVALTQNTINGGVLSGDQIQFTSSNAIVAGTTSSAVTPTTVSMSIPAVAGGVITGDQIQFTTFAEYRSYLYTYISAYGEEGPPSPATVAGGGPTGTWVITVYSPSSAQLLNRNLTTIRLYRTVTDSAGNATYFQIADIPITTAGAAIVYNDSFLDTAITNNIVLPSDILTGPPAGLDAVIMMANGMMAGFTNKREIWFSEAYLPHAWPATWALTVDYPVVGMAAIGSMANILTEGQPFIAAGTTPSTVTMGKITANEPCISRGSIFPAGEGVYYASPNGLILLNTAGTINTTQFSMEKEYWESLLPEKWAGGRVGLSYTAFIKGSTSTSGADPLTGGTNINGVVLDHLEKNVPLSLTQGLVEPGETMENLFWDEWSGQIFMVHGGTPGVGVRWWLPPANYNNIKPYGTLFPWIWKSKKFRLPFPAKFKAFKINFEVPEEITITPPSAATRNNDQNQVFNPLTQYLILRVFADGKQIVVREVIKDNEVILIPFDDKATYWEVQCESQCYVYLFKMAGSVKELRKA